LRFALQKLHQGGAVRAAPPGDRVVPGGGLVAARGGGRIAAGGDIRERGGTERLAGGLRVRLVEQRREEAERLAIRHWPRQQRGPQRRSRV
jgi:hypothetical protein